MEEKKFSEFFHDTEVSPSNLRAQCFRKIISGSIIYFLVNFELFIYCIVGKLADCEILVQNTVRETFEGF